VTLPTKDNLKFFKEKLKFGREECDKPLVRSYDKTLGQIF
jgi:hypothetical protein